MEPIERNHDRLTDREKQAIETLKSYGLIIGEIQLLFDKAGLPRPNSTPQDLDKKLNTVMEHGLKIKQIKDLEKAIIRFNAYCETDFIVINSYRNKPHFDIGVGFGSVYNLALYIPKKDDYASTKLDFNYEDVTFKNIENPKDFLCDLTGNIQWQYMSDSDKDVLNYYSKEFSKKIHAERLSEQIDSLLKTDVKVKIKPVKQ